MINIELIYKKIDNSKITLMTKIWQQVKKNIKKMFINEESRGNSHWGREPDRNPFHRNKPDRIHLLLVDTMDKLPNRDQDTLPMTMAILLLVYFLSYRWLDQSWIHAEIRHSMSTRNTVISYLTTSQFNMTVETIVQWNHLIQYLIFLTRWHRFIITRH